MKKCAAFAFLLAAATSHAVVGTTSRATSASPDGGWSGVGRMSGASAVAIGPHLVLTAGHVGAGDFVLDGQTYTATSTEKAPKVDRKATDLRLVRVAETIPTWYDVASSVKKGAKVTMVGFGATGVVKDDGKGYALQGSVGRSVGGNTISGKATMKGEGPSLRAMIKRAGDSILAVGDSGGGWFVGGKLVGISAFVFSESSKKAQYGFSKDPYFGSGAIDLTNKTLRKWLDGEIAGDASAASLVAAPGVQAVPEPGSYAALGLGMLIVLRRRRKA